MRVSKEHTPQRLTERMIYMKAKRILSVILALAMLALCTACSAASAEAAGADAGSVSAPPEKPDGGKSPFMPDRQQPPDVKGGFDGGSGEVVQGTSANTISTDGTYSGETYTSDGDDENALRIDGASVTLRGVTVDKSSGASSDPESGDFYGMNAAVLATNGAQVELAGARISSDARNGNGVFCYGSGTTVTVSDSAITTNADNSGGIQTAGGGTTIANGLTVSTSGSSSAAIRSDRGGGTVKVTGGTYTSSGLNSPAVYSTADISVEGAALTATGSEALVVEGGSSIALTDCDVSGSMSRTEGTSSGENVHNVMIYQSMSGDADVGTASLSIKGGSLTGESGDMFYITNTRAVVTLSGVRITDSDESGYLMRVTGNSGERGWGKAGANGARAEVTADEQTLEGDILVDSISALSLTLKNGSTFTGSVSILKNTEGSAAEGSVSVVLGKGCTWTLTGNCTISTLENNGLIDFNGYSITLADGSVLS